MNSEILEIVNQVKSGKTTARKEVEKSLAAARKHEELHSLLEIFPEEALKRADEIDAKIAAGEKVGKLAGVPYVAKDNFLTTIGHTTAASKILENFESPINAIAIERLNNEGAILIGKANLDAFAHGGSTENSAFGATKNAKDQTRVAGGSSGGSAAAVAAGIVPFALGSDTGGSIRQPASFNGVVGYKPTYGLISRYGVVAMANSTDVVGSLARTVADAEILCEILAGQDGKDGTVLPDYFTRMDDEKENLHAVDIYDQIAEEYAKKFDNMNDDSDLVFLNTYVQHLKKGDRVLDLGCGTGAACRYFAKHELLPEGIDLAKGMIAIAQKKNPELNFRIANMLTYKPEGTFDSVYAGYSLHHFKQSDAEKVIKNIGTYLKKDGIIGLVVQEGEGEFETDEPFLSGEKIFVRLFSREKITEMLKKIGVEIIETKVKKATEGEFPYDKLLIIGKKTTSPEPEHLKIGLIKEFLDEGVDPEVRAKTMEAVDRLKKLGHTVEEVDLPMTKYAIAIYYIVVPAELSSNLARYDGIRYGLRAGVPEQKISEQKNRFATKDSEIAKSELDSRNKSENDAHLNLDEIYGHSRNAGFMPENKRRIMIGAFVLSSGYFDAYYLQAQKARTLLIREFDKLFADYDFLIGPVAPTPAFKLGENVNDPLKMYLADIMTVPASLAGLPAISVPNSESKEGLPIGLQIIGKMKDDARLLDLAREIEEAK